MIIADTRKVYKNYEIDGIKWGCTFKWFGYLAVQKSIGYYLGSDSSYQGEDHDSN